MLSLDADPVLLEASELASELRHTQRALITDCRRLFGADRADQLRTRLSGATPDRMAKVAKEQPEPLRLLADGLVTLRRRLADLLKSPAHRELIAHALTGRARALRLGLHIQGVIDQQHALTHDADQIVAQAAGSGRSLTVIESSRIEQLRASADDGDGPTAQITSPELRDGVFDTLAALQLRRARRELDAGLLLTDQMQSIIREALPALHRGEPLLLVGETGGAKTALAEHLAHHGMGLTSELVSGYGDITSAQVIGTTELRADAGATRSVFVPGPLLRAMTLGHPLILDEINAMPPEFLKRLNRILQLRPGDHFSVQENAGEPVRIAPGFVVLATANEQTPHRYRGLERLSAELINRFGANSYRVRYPDSGLGYSDFPAENALLASAAVVDRSGEFRREVSPAEIERIARAAFISQQVFSGAHGEGFGDYVSSERTIDGRPGLEEAVLAPRTLVAILTKVAGSAGAVSLDHALSRFVEGVLHREDRHVLTLILEGQGFRLT